MDSKANFNMNFNTNFNEFYKLHEFLRVINLMNSASKI
jgi:hypothetical protein